MHACRDCHHFRLDPADRLTPHGFGRCTQLAVGHYRSRHAVGCYLTPSRYEAAR